MRNDLSDMVLYRYRRTCGASCRLGCRRRENPYMYKGAKKMTESPCKCCAERNAVCHAFCKRYKDWSALHQDEISAEKAKRAVYRAINGYEIGKARENYVRKWKNKRKKGV